MNFYVNLNSISVTKNNGFFSTTLMDSRKIGTDLLKELNLTNEDISSSEINGVYNNRGVYFQITLEEAEKTNMFKNKSEIEVKIEKCFMPKLFDILLKDRELIYKFNKEKAKEFWFEHNCSTFIVSEESKNKIEEYEKQKEEQEKQEKEKKIKEEQERIAWIKEHGSDYLKKCLDNNIKAYPEYVTERSEKEFPEFKIDIKDEANWKELYSPSEKALNEFVEIKKEHPELKIELVYLERFDEECHPCEAIVIRDYFGYDLINVITYINDDEY